ncbi:MAG: hypothetical protein NC541_13510 [bacterium]|nr:hypothetical protein [bacterium]MCM1499975.1 hypothetical protein [Clostridium sp.]
MGINVENADTRAIELYVCATQLQDIKKTVAQYSMELNDGWRSVETDYYLQALSNVGRTIDQAVVELGMLDELIRTTARQVRIEENSVEECEKENTVTGEVKEQVSQEIGEWEQEAKIHMADNIKTLFKGLFSGKGNGRF